MAACLSSFALLSSEIDKIVSVPYTVLLKTLSRILFNISDDEILLWTIVKGCQLHELISRILSALDRDGAAWPVLVNLIGLCEFRDEVIKQDPSVLSLLFQRADDEKVYAACLSICASPFPERFSPSQDYFDFVDGVLTNSRGENQDAWIEHAHNLLSNIPALTLSTIDDDVISTCVELWSESCKATGNVAFITFLSIAAVVHCKSMEYTSSFGSDTISLQATTPFSSWAKKCSSFFSDLKAMKVVKSVLLRALQIVSEKSLVQESGFLSCLNMIRQVLGAMSSEVLQDSMRDREVVQAMMKVVQKGTQKNLSSRAQLYLSGILITLDPDCQYWDISLSRSFFTQNLDEIPAQPFNLDSNRVSPNLTNLKVQRRYPDLLQVVLSHRLTGKATLESMVQSYIQLCRPGVRDSSDLICSLTSAINLMSNVSDLINREKLNNDTLDFLITIRMPDWWDWVLSSVGKPAACWKKEICPCIKDRLQQQLMSCISSTMLRFACVSGKKLETRSYDLLQAVICQCNEARKVYQCSYPQTALFHSSASAETMSMTPETCSSVGDGLETTLSMLNTQYEKAIRKHVEEVCFDLQRRCENVEEPLRAEQVKVKALENQLREARDSTSLMRDEHKARRLSLEHAINTAKQENALLKAQHSANEQDLKQANEQLQSISDKIEASENANVDLNEQYKTLEGELRQEKLRVDKLVYERDALMSENTAVQQQLQQARDKQQRLLCVLNGGFQNSTS